MDIFVRNLPDIATNRQLQDYFEGPLRDCGILVYHVNKHRDKPTATITVPSIADGQRFLDAYGTPSQTLSRYTPPRRLYLSPNYLVCTKGRFEPSDFSIQSLALEAAERAKSTVTNGATRVDKHRDLSRFNISTLHCGSWEYPSDLRSKSSLVFVSHFEDHQTGQIHIGRRETKIVLGTPGHDQCRIDIAYHDCIDITLGTYEEPSVTFNLRQPPKMYQIKADEVLSAQMTALALGGRIARTQAPKKIRLSHISEGHRDPVASTCWVYRVVLVDTKQLSNFRSILDRKATKSSLFFNKTSLQYPEQTLKESFRILNHELTDQSPSYTGSRPFKLRFQIYRLAQNGLLPPERVYSLIPKVKQVYQERGLDATLSALRRLARDLESLRPGLSIEADEFSKQRLEEYVEHYALHYDASEVGNPYELAKRYKHMILVHKLIFTPTGTRLAGPDLEPANRVLRRYPRNLDHFARALFQDEDGTAVRYESRTDNKKIYHERFKGALDKATLICGMGFSFLGFSHSSLRTQSCWFMAPLVKGGKILLAEHVIRELGEFDKIRVPAKCAARIGQNFTDTNATVELRPEEVGELPNVVRSGRDFSDGVGTISQGLIEEVWRVYGTRKLLKPTVLQIRFQGAKGLVSLDPHLGGRRLMLRPNMRKFVSQASWNLEICGAGFRPLPMVLNRQFIKIFEDLGVQKDIFFDLQRAAMKRMRLMTASSINTATLLEETEGIRGTPTPTLIRDLGHMGLDYHQDAFLYSVVEMAVISKVRDVKYRGRIPVEEGVTLYGIMDETGYLKEGEIYVVTEMPPEGGRSVVVRDKVLITRSPALHPGDMQVVKAVDVPSTSPLKHLSNVIVFSQHGERDLPSQLGGGDLDGDLYNVIWSPRMIPAFSWVAADYPRVEAVELDRPVTRKDMSDFFVTFMESDQLGNICNTHLQLADQKESGTFDPDCIRLAEFASTAVDFSKTGIPVDMSSAPRPDHCRPDFMAPNPRVVVNTDGYMDFDEEDEDDEDVAFEGLDTERRPHRYYASKKVLGELYRAIDERSFLASMQQEHVRLVQTAATSVTKTSSEMMSKVLEYCKRWATSYGVLYDHHRRLAKEIKKSYEESLIDILYDFEPTVHCPLTEGEVFAGQILGRQTGPQNKSLREQSTAMRERFEIIFNHTAMRMNKGDKAMKEAANLDDLYDETRYSDREFEGFPRALACLEVALTVPGHRDRKIGEVRSFKYIAAGVCLRELDRYRITTFGSQSGLPGYDL